MKTESVVKLAVPLAVGAAQPMVLREFVFKDSDTDLIPQLGVFGKTSSVVNYALAGGAIALGMYGMMKGKGPLGKKDHGIMALMYGVPALVEGLMLDYMEYSAETVPVVSYAAQQPPRVFNPVPQPMPQRIAAPQAVRSVSVGAPQTAERGVF